MLAGRTEKLASSQARGALHVLTAVNAVEFQETVEGIDSIHNFKRCCFRLASGNAESGGEKYQHFFRMSISLL
jgi:hypothetical protein